MNRMMRDALLADYAINLHQLLMRVRPKKPDLGVRLLLEKALRLEQSRGLALDRALPQVYRECEVKVERMLALVTDGSCSVEPASRR